MNLMHLYDPTCHHCQLRRRADWLSFRLEVQLSRGKSVEQFSKTVTELAAFDVREHPHVQP